MLYTSTQDCGRRLNLAFDVTFKLPRIERPSPSQFEHAKVLTVWLAYLSDDRRGGDTRGTRFARTDIDGLAHRIKLSFLVFASNLSLPTNHVCTQPHAEEETCCVELHDTLSA